MTTSSSDPTFVGSRLALFGKTVAWLALAFYVVLFPLYVSLGADPLAYVLDRRNLSHLGGTAVMGTLWFVARGARSRRTLDVLDAASVVTCCALWAVRIDATSESPYVAVLASCLTVVARAIIVPSTPRRTLVLGVCAMSPTLVFLFAFAPHGASLLVLALRLTLWMTAAIAIATLGSDVIYGLREKVKEAAELGAYVLEKKIGSGGMGEVWRAHHRMLIRPAAIKLMRTQANGSGADDVLLRRFEREARATANLKCPHTVELYDFGISDDGAFYYVMELLEGFNLQQLVQRFGPLPAERVVHILEQVCCSLGEAHANGLVHRDVKPANIFVTRVPMTADMVKVLDFGLVTIAAKGNGGPTLTAAGTATGTPGFMAPECAAGEGSGDHRADLYSLGCVAYWLLTGKLVFEGNSTFVLVQHARSQPPPPSTRTELPIPSELEQLVLDCLEKDPSRRPRDAAAIVERLQHVPLASPWTQERAKHWWSSHAPEVGAHESVADLVITPRTPVRHKLSYSARVEA